MPELFFPQLSSGVSVQYPIGKSRFLRTIQNVMADGHFYAAPDPGAGRLLWQLSYVDLSLADITTLQNFFDACSGPMQAFTFIDPTGNMLVESLDFTRPPWQTTAGLISWRPGVADPFGGIGAFTATNTSQIVQAVTQTLPPSSVPANDQYCFSVYARSDQPMPTPIALTRAGASQSNTISCSLSQDWTRLVSSGQLMDSGTQFTVAISLAPGQTVSLYGPQLEAQPGPSHYRPTTSTGGVYTNAHWAVDELPIVANAPNLYSVSFTIETALQG